MKRKNPLIKQRFARTAEENYKLIGSPADHKRGKSIMKVFLVPLLANDQIDALRKAENKYILLSFYHLNKSKKLGMVEDLFTDNFLLDSGAFTFMNSKKDAEIDWEKYIDEYAEFINKYNIKYFFELDIDVVVGTKEVERLRDKLERLTGKQCIPVWHKFRGVEYFKNLCKTYKYIAIGGLVTKEITQKEYPTIQKMVAYANKNGVKVHGLGFTNMKWLKRIKWATVDSTSWQGTNISYRLYKFIGNQIKGFPIRGFDTPKRIPLLETNAREWVKFQKHAEKSL